MALQIVVEDNRFRVEWQGLKITFIGREVAEKCSPCHTISVITIQ